MTFFGEGFSSAPALKAAEVSVSWPVAELGLDRGNKEYPICHVCFQNVPQALAHERQGSDLCVIATGPQEPVSLVMVPGRPDRTGLGEEEEPSLG